MVSSARAQRAGGVGVLGLAEDIAAVVVGVNPRLARRLIVLAGQLIEAIVDVGGTYEEAEIHSLISLPSQLFINSCGSPCCIHPQPPQRGA